MPSHPCLNSRGFKTILTTTKICVLLPLLVSMATVTMKWMIFCAVRKVTLRCTSQTLRDSELETQASFFQFSKVADINFVDVTGDIAYCWKLILKRGEEAHGCSLKTSLARKIRIQFVEAKNHTETDSTERRLDSKFGSIIHKQLGLMI